nr:MAG: nonstructural protein [Microvirus sp.]
MIHKLYSVRDSKAEYFEGIFPAKTHGEAERGFTTAVNDPKSTISKFPEDYDLYYLGEFDDHTGKISAKPSPEHIVKGINVVRQKSNFSADQSIPMN